MDLVVDVGGPATFDQSTAALRYGGTMSILGVLTGTSGPVNTYAIFYRTLRVLGIYVGSVEMSSSACLVPSMRRSCTLIIDWVFPFAERGKGLPAPRLGEPLRQGSAPADAQRPGSLPWGVLHGDSTEFDPRAKALKSVRRSKV